MAGASRTEAQVLKTAGYIISSVSVLLLGIVSWSSASAKPLMLACLVAGMLASIAGMVLRWLSYRQEQREKQRIARTAQAAASEPAR